MLEKDAIEFIDNSAVEGKEDQYLTIEVDVALVLESWAHSLFSYEWLNEKGEIKALELMQEAEKTKRQHIEKLLEQKSAISKAILGIGLQENIEIGIGKPEFLTLAAKGIPTIPVHISKLHQEEFKKYIL